MKKYLINILFIASCLFGVPATANQCEQVYTIGAYDDAFSQGKPVIKLGPLSATEVPPVLPKSFLEKDGSYAGGEAFCSVKQATDALQEQLASGVLPANERWHIYVLDAHWDRDIYQLKLNDFRLKHSVNVLKLAIEECSIAQEEDNLLSLSYNDFDQAKEGWRKYAKLACYNEVAVLIDKYLECHWSMLTSLEHRALTWHAGQMYAFNNEYEIAKLRFTYSLDPNESADSLIRWNDYVNATIAFLDNDLNKLQWYRDRIADGSMVNGTIPNLDVVEGLIIHFGQPYYESYIPRD